MIYENSYSSVRRWARYRPSSAPDNVEMKDVTADFLTELEHGANPATGMNYTPKYLAGYLNSIKPWAESFREKT